MNASEIVKSLHRHCRQKCLTYSEVKDGATWYRGNLRKVDFLAIEKSWSPVCIRAYEVKVSRADFLRDDKWPAYMALSHKFFWACPSGLIKKEEVDPRAGLCYVNPKSGRVSVVKAAPYRDVDLDPSLLLYLVFWRTETPQRQGRMDAIKAEMEERDALGKRYAEFVSAKVREAARRVRDAEARVEVAEHHANTLEERMGAFVRKVHQWKERYRIGDWEIDRLLAAVGDARTLAPAKNALLSAQEAINGLVSLLAAEAPPETTERGQSDG